MSIHDPQQVCILCGHVGYPKKVSNGSFAIEVIIWAIFIAIAASSSYWILLAPLAYSVSRTFVRKNVCELCNGTQIIPADSPNGKALLDSKSNQNSNA